MTKASLIVIGSELTRGIIQDKHTILVSHELSKMGIHFSESVVIPDDGTIREVIGALLRNNDIVLLTGGLGPTTDDMTRSAIAEAAGVELVRDEGAWNHLLETLKDRAYGANEKQAYIPKGFNLIPNPNGTAPGFWGEVKGTLVVSMPGPPREMEPMFRSSVLPLLRRNLGMKEEEMKEIASIISNVLRNAHPVRLTKGEKAGQLSKNKAKCPPEVMEDARGRVKALLKRFVLYPELDLDYLKEQFL